MEKKEKVVFVFSVFLVAFAVLLYNFIPSTMNFRTSEEDYIGLMTFSKGDVQIRYAESINWKKLQKNDRVYGNSYLFTGPGATGSYVFVDQSRLSLEENSLVYLDFPEGMEEKKTYNIDLLDGNIKLVFAKDSKASVRVNDKVVKPGKEETKLLLEGGGKLELMVFEGEADILNEEDALNVNVKTGEKLRMAGSGSAYEKGVISGDLVTEMDEFEEYDQAEFIELQKKRQLTYLITHIFTFFDVFYQGGSSDKVDP